MMSNIHVAKLLKRVGPTEDGQYCRLDFDSEDGSESALVFPIDQLEAFLALLLQVEQRKNEISPDSPGAKTALRADSVSVSLEPKTQTVLFDFHVDKMSFAFTLPREDAVNLVQIVHEKLPTH